MKKFISVSKKINLFKKKTIEVTGDKSLSIRFVLLSSISQGKCIAYNLLKSDDVINAINCIRKLGIKVSLQKNKCEIHGKGLFGFRYKKKLILNAGNSGTTARLLNALIIDSNHEIKITGDDSLKKRDMGRIIKPLKMFGASYKSDNKKLPLLVKGTKFLKPIKYIENLGSAQCKSAVMLAALKTDGKTLLKCLPSRDHTELIFKNVLKIPIKIKKQRKYEFIEVKGLKEFSSFNYKISGDISSASFLIVLTLLSKNESLIIKNVNINPTRTGVIKILNSMGAQIKFLNKKKYKGEKIGDIFVRSNNNLNSINLNPKLNSSAIDEFLLIFLVASRCKGISIFKNLKELNKKESKRLDWGIKILTLIGIKVRKLDNDGIKIWGNPEINIKKKLL